ncbi:MAG: hypothetical protein IJE07_12685 [Clostridia bacterium]|nr:hypothetical protein [Clostridia bacterium]
MLKLLKYEFRKGLTSILVMLAITAALEGYFLYGLFSWADDGVHTAIAGMMLLFMTLAVYVFVLVRGVTSYSGELKSRSAYLIFMTPHSTRKIIASKFLFTFVLGVLFGGLYIGLGVVDVGLLLRELGELEEFIEMFREAMQELGIRVDQIAMAAVFTVIYMVLSLLSFFAVAYLAVTLSHTLFRDKSWRWVMAILFYFMINYGIGLINSIFPTAYMSMRFTEAPGVGNLAEAYGIQTAPTFKDLLILVVPQALVSLATIIASFFGCAWMLDKKVSL